MKLVGWQAGVLSAPSRLRVAGIRLIRSRIGPGYLQLTLDLWWWSIWVGHYRNGD